MCVYVYTYCMYTVRIHYIKIQSESERRKLVRVMQGESVLCVFLREKEREAAGAPHGSSLLKERLNAFL